jgi:hypothetical protein
VFTHGVGWLNERVVDSDDGDIAVLDAGEAVSMYVRIPWPVLLMDSRIAEDNATNAAETVDTDLESRSALVCPRYPAASSCYVR